MLDSKVRGSALNAVDAHIGERAATRRKTLGLSLGDVAQALGVDRTMMSELEHGRRRMAARQLWALSRHLQVPMAWFFKTPGHVEFIPLH